MVGASGNTAKETSLASLFKGQTLRQQSGHGLVEYDRVCEMGLRIQDEKQNMA